ncbi:hypothetical protein C8R43DRAFT_1054741 [Mycena crocata]|nr:hypothetical protein C8R43DRAFT_1054741 [Mycena crocata]
MFFRFYNLPGLHLLPEKRAQLRGELLEIARTSLNPVPDYQCLSSRPDALDDKLIIVAYTGTESDDSDETKQERSPTSGAVAFTSAIYLDVPGLDHPVFHTGLTVAAPSLQRTGILVQLFAQLFLNVLPLHPDGLWVTTLAAVLSSLVQSEKFLYNTYPSPPARNQNNSVQRTPAASPGPQHRAIAHAVDKQYRATLLISPDAHFDGEMFVFRDSMDWSAAAPFRKDLDDQRFWHRDSEANHFFRGLMRPGKGDEVLLVGFIDLETVWKAIEHWQRRLQQKSRL